MLLAARKVFIENSLQNTCVIFCACYISYKSNPARSDYLNARDADKFLARPGRKQTTATKDCEFHTSYS